MKYYGWKAVIGMYANLSLSSLLNSENKNHASMKASLKIRQARMLRTTLLNRKNIW
jgi:hypothetical protein